MDWSGLRKSTELGGNTVNIVKTSEWLISENKAGGEKYWRLHITQADVF